MFLLITEKVKQTVKVLDVSMGTTQDDKHTEGTELVVLVSYSVSRSVVQ